MNKDLQFYKQEMKERKQARKRAKLASEFYSIRSIVGNDWAMFFFLIGGREAGKSYATTEMFVRQWLKYKRVFYWIRLTEKSKQKLLQNNAEKLIDPDIRRKYHLELVTNGGNVYAVTQRSNPDKNGRTRILKKELMARVLDLSTFYNDKGSGYFDKDYLRNNPQAYYNIALDEMNREKSEKNTFDIVYNFTNQIENLIRSTKQRVRIICIGNTLDEASDLLAGFDFLPDKFGRYYLRKKRAVIEYIEPSKAYIERRKGTAADILMPDASTFTNVVHVDKSLIDKSQLQYPQYVIKFTKDKKDWFTIWQGNDISRWNGEKKSVIAMRPYLDEQYNSQSRDNIISGFDARAFKYHDLITFKLFQKNIELLKPRK